MEVERAPRECASELRGCVRRTLAGTACATANRREARVGSALVEWFSRACLGALSSFCGKVIIRKSYIYTFMHVQTLSKNLGPM